MKRLHEKGIEFFALARHLHARGMSEVIQECIPIVKEMKAQGKSFDDYYEFIKQETGFVPTLEDDLFGQRIKEMFEVDGE